MGRDPRGERELPAQLPAMQSTNPPSNIQEYIQGYKQNNIYTRGQKKGKEKKVVTSAICNFDKPGLSNILISNMQVFEEKTKF